MTTNENTETCLFEIIFSATARKTTAIKRFAIAKVSLDKYVIPKPNKPCPRRNFTVSEIQSLRCSTENRLVFYSSRSSTPDIGYSCQIYLATRHEDTGHRKVLYTTCLEKQKAQ